MTFVRRGVVEEADVVELSSFSDLADRRISGHGHAAVTANLHFLSNPNAAVTVPVTCTFCLKSLITEMI